MIKKLLIPIFFIMMALSLFSQTVHKETYSYSEKDSLTLKMDIYKSDTISPMPQPCLMFVFGGGFKDGKRDAEIYLPYFHYFAERGFTVVSIDYRLGMKGKKAPGVLNHKPLRNAIDIAVEDLYAATNYLLENSTQLGIDPTQIIISGSSAGAITVLQADYANRDNHPSAGVLPDDFRYAGVISFAGAIFSAEGVPSYTDAPAPTLFFHGSSDKLVPFGNTRFLKLGMFGSAPLAKRFKAEGYPYVFYIMEEVGHEVSEYPMHEFLPEINQFITEYVLEGSEKMIDIQINDPARRSTSTTTPGDYYN